MFDSRTRLSADVVAEVKRVFGEKVFGSIIPRSIRLAEAPSYGLPIPYYAPDSHAAESYQNLAAEVIQQDGVTIPEMMG